MSNPHDALFRFTFSQLPHAASLLRDLVEEPLASALDWETLQAVPASTADQSLHLHHADLLFRCALAPDGPASDGNEVFFVLEHKSAPVAGLLRQLHRYVMHIAVEWERTHGGVPDVIPVVVHHGRRPPVLEWRSRRSGAPAVIGALSRFQPRLRVLLDDLYRAAEADVAARPLTSMATLTLLCLSQLAGMSDAHVIDALARWRGWITTVTGERDGHLCLGAVASYVLNVTDLPAERLVRVIATTTTSRENPVMSTADKLRAEGRAQGKAETLLQLLAARFGTVSPATAQRVRAADIADLERWTLRVLGAPTIADVFARD